MQAKYVIALKITWPEHVTETMKETQKIPLKSHVNE